MKKIIIIVYYLILLPHFGFAYTQLDGQPKGTHYAITSHAIDQSNTKDYLNDYLGIKLSDKFSGPESGPVEHDPPTVQELISYGADWEDGSRWSPRPFNHFYDPTTGQGLSLPALPDCWPNPVWAYSASDWSWLKARQFFHDALFTNDNTAKELNFAQTFRALGQIVHLLQDMAVPAHTRNDAHPDFLAKITLKPYQLDMYELWAAEHISQLPYTGYAAPSSADLFNNFTGFWHNSIMGSGLADFTNRSFTLHKG